MHTKLAIVGGGVTMMQAPFHDESVDIWSTGSVAAGIPRVTEIFDIHKTAIQPLSVFEKHNAVVWMQEDNEYVKHSQRFPIEELESWYGKIFDCSMSMMMAFAIDRGYDTIELYGVDMALKDEYERTRANLLYLIGYARGAGVNVKISEGSLLMPPCRTYEYDEPSEREKKIASYEIEMAQKLRAVNEQKIEVHGQAEYLRGALEMMRELRKYYGG